MDTRRQCSSMSTGAAARSAPTRRNEPVPGRNGRRRRQDGGLRRARPSVDLGGGTEDVSVHALERRCWPDRGGGRGAARDETGLVRAQDEFTEQDIRLLEREQLHCKKTRRRD
jgi:hypothetical protein